MYPRDNVFQIYYNIGKRLPFQVKRSPMGTKGSYNEEYRYSKEGRTFMVESVKIHNRIYGEAYGYMMIDGIRVDNDLYMEEYNGTIPSAGSGEWVLIDVPGVNLNEIFPVHDPDFVVPFGKYKGKTLEEIYKIDPQYVFWLDETDRYFHINFKALAGIDPNAPDIEKQAQKEIDRVFPKTKLDDIIPFGKYKGKTFRELGEIDLKYLVWFTKNTTLDFDKDSFKDFIHKCIEVSNK
ncbi:MAG: hypothetical protein IKX63_04865 [Muribaculaceae bacterium]|nr:hypothetical protein [Muribaculaceae bacterium]